MINVGTRATRRAAPLEQFSLSTRITLGALLLFLLAAAAIAVLLDNRERGLYLGNRGHQLALRARTNAQELQREIDALRQNVLFLALTPPVKGIIRATANHGFDARDQNDIGVWKKRLQETYAAFVAAHPDCLQVRFIGLADNGLELVRVNSSQGRAQIVSPGQLQQKADRDYFQATLELKAGEVYLSEINLNRELGRVQTPLARTLRAATPVFAENGSLFGMVVVNLDVGPILDRLVANSPDDVQTYLMNERGDYLIHPDPAQTFGFDLGQIHRWQDDFPAVALIANSAKDTLTGAFQTLASPAGLRHVVLSQTNFDPRQPQRYLAFGYALPDALVQARLAGTRNIIFLAASVAAMVLGLLFYFGLRRTLAPLRVLTDVALAVGQGQYDVSLPEISKGELGALVAAIRNMQVQIKTRDRQIQQIHDELVLSEAYANQIIDSIPEGIVVVDAQGLLVRVNAHTEKIFGYPQNELLGQPVEMLVPANLHAKHASLRKAYATAGSPRPMGLGSDLFGVHRDGHQVPIEVGLSPLQFEGVRYSIAVVVDISERRAIELALRVSEERFRSLIEHAPDAIVLLDVDAKCIVDANPRAEVLFECSRSELLGGGLERFYAHVQPGGLTAAQSIEQDLMRTFYGESVVVERTIRYPSGRELIVEARVDDMSEGGRRLVRGSFIDISEKKRAEATIWRQANYDLLTGLPNRNLLLDRLDHEIKNRHRKEERFALMFIDLDNFKEVNDTLGHHCGDQLLVEAAKRIGACVRESDTLARLGGDEFTIILVDLDDALRIEQAAQQILLALGRPYVISEHVAHITASLGITLYPTDAADIESLLKHADQAMYEAKALGRNRFCYFTKEMQQAAQTRQLLGNDLRLALSANQMVVYYQPIVDLTTLRCVKAEALLRWNHPTRNVGPTEFIPLAEQIGLISELGDWVFRQAATCVKQWIGMNSSCQQVSVNKSPLQFDDDKAYLASIAFLQSINLPANSICIEITEGLLLDERPGVQQSMARFRDLGIQISLDDFGTGYSAMSYLKKFTLDYLKIDKSFVDNMVTDPADRAIVEAIIAMAHKLGFQVVAEGVETVEQRDFLMVAGCDFAQGYLFAKPMPNHEFMEYIRNAQDTSAA